MASEDVYGGDGLVDEMANHPRLVIAWGVPGVALKPVTTAISWGIAIVAAYADRIPGDDSNDLGDYELHRTRSAGRQNSCGFHGEHGDGKGVSPRRRGDRPSRSDDVAAMSPSHARGSSAGGCVLVSGVAVGPSTSRISNALPALTYS
ncbi:hypothetical protein [Nonomuraea sp. NPDC005501]|uniref:hypothetical protein n=1 Tax=Nonomuraea sp. NPDC005501 TaxID=3156884 RepID=UPI00339E4E69